MHGRITEWTEQQCIDEAVMLGLSEAKGRAYYVHYGGVGWQDGANRPITNLRLHMTRLKLSGWWPKMPKVKVSVSPQEYRQKARETHEDWLRGQSVAKLKDMSAHLDKNGYYGQVPGWLIQEILKERQNAAK
jgi:hypothetical protein